MPNFFFASDSYRTKACRNHSLIPFRTSGTAICNCCRIFCPPSRSRRVWPSSFTPSSRSATTSSRRYAYTYVDIYQCCGSGMFLSDPETEFFLSRLPAPGSVRFLDYGSASASKNLSTAILTLKFFSKLSERIRILAFYPSRIPDPVVKEAPDPDSQH